MGQGDILCWFVEILKGGCSESQPYVLQAGLRDHSDDCGVARTQLEAKRKRPQHVSWMLWYYHSPKDEKSKGLNSAMCQAFISSGLHLDPELWDKGAFPREEATGV